MHMNFITFRKIITDSVAICQARLHRFFVTISDNAPGYFFGRWL
jgi:hypothetical protein